MAQTKTLNRPIFAVCPRTIEWMHKIMVFIFFDQEICGAGAATT
jgi:hypothetical protein